MTLLLLTRARASASLLLRRLLQLHQQEQLLHQQEQLLRQQELLQLHQQEPWVQHRALSVRMLLLQQYLVATRLVLNVSGCFCFALLNVHSLRAVSTAEGCAS